jgi:prepilin-type processing-associated H-X9-DG protein
MIGVIAYGNDNHWYFPGSAITPTLSGGGPFAGDWIHWQSSRNFNDSAIARYLGRPVDPELFRCPSDDFSARPRALDWGPNTFQPTLTYPYSYCYNRCFGSAEVLYWRRNPMWHDNGFIVVQSTKVKDSAGAILIGEVDDRHMADAAWEPAFGTADGIRWAELLSIRHDRPMPRERWGPGYKPDESNPDGRGNVAFVDGHVEYVTRRFAHDVRHWGPHLYEAGWGQ